MAFHVAMGGVDAALAQLGQLTDLIGVNTFKNSLQLLHSNSMI